MKTFNYLLLSICTLYGCVSMTPEAANVIVHTEASNLLDSCERLGNVNSKVTGFTQIGGRPGAQQQAEYNIRDEAYKKYGADTVVIVNTDTYINTVSLQGIAFRCNK